MNVVIYTTATCPWCHRAKEYLRSHNISFKEIRVDQDPQGIKEILRLTGQAGVPVIVINGRPIVGFDKQKIDNMLNIKG
uniref:Glutaredoxin family protein n=1 Tax=candidate division WOR-3 bacterium TaxID=2052148 RepID=A0A7C4YI77_UNCW3